MFIEMMVIIPEVQLGAGRHVRKFCLLRHGRFLLTLLYGCRPTSPTDP